MAEPKATEEVGILGKLDASGKAPKEFLQEIVLAQWLAMAAYIKERYPNDRDERILEDLRRIIKYADDGVLASSVFQYCLSKDPESPMMNLADRDTSPTEFTQEVQKINQERLEWLRRVLADPEMKKLMEHFRETHELSQQTR